MKASEKLESKNSAAEETTVFGDQDHSSKMIRDHEDIQWVAID